MAAAHSQHAHLQSHVDRLADNIARAHNLVSIYQALGGSQPGRRSVDVVPVQQFFPELDKMMARRHQIVHRADCTAATGRGRHRAQSLRASVVEKWINVVLNFHAAIQYQVQLKQAQNV